MGDGDSEGSEGALPSIGMSNVIVGGWPTLVRFLSSRLASPMALPRFLSLGAAGGASGSALSDSNAVATRAEISTASSARRSR